MNFRHNKVNAKATLDGIHFLEGTGVNEGNYSIAAEPNMLNLDTRDTR